jgi:hypothetical protein
VENEQTRKIENMNMITARAYKTHKLSDDRLKRMQEIERHNGRCCMPYEIRDANGIDNHGEIPESSWRQVEHRVLSIYNDETIKANKEYERTKTPVQDFYKDEVWIIHQTDWEIRKADINFDYPTGRIETISKIKNYTDSHYEPIRSGNI